MQIEHTILINFNNEFINLFNIVCTMSFHCTTFTLPHTSQTSNPWNIPFVAHSNHPLCTLYSHRCFICGKFSVQNCDRVGAQDENMKCIEMTKFMPSILRHIHFGAHNAAMLALDIACNEN